MMTDYRNIKQRLFNQVEEDHPDWTEESVRDEVTRRWLRMIGFGVYDE